MNQRNVMPVFKHVLEPEVLIDLPADCVISGQVQRARIQVVGECGGVPYEWMIRDESGRPVSWSDDGYGCQLLALRDAVESLIGE